MYTCDYTKHVVLSRRELLNLLFKLLEVRPSIGTYNITTAPSSSHVTSALYFCMCHAMRYLRIFYLLLYPSVPMFAKVSDWHTRNDGHVIRCVGVSREVRRTRIIQNKGIRKMSCYIGTMT